MNLETVHSFISRLLPWRLTDGFTFSLKEDEFVSLSAEGSDFKLSRYNVIAGAMVPMSTITLNPGIRGFWVNVVVAVKTLTGAEFGLESDHVAGSVLAACGIVSDTGAGVVYDRSIPVVQRDEVVTVKSRRGTRKREVDGEDEDILDN